MSYDPKKEAAVLKAAIEAKTVAEVDQLVALMEDMIGGPVSWRPVGDNDSNHGALTASSDARLAWLERMTNGVDAVLELEMRLRYGDDLAAAIAAMPNPRAAAHHLLGVPPEGPGFMGIKDRQALAERVQATLLESGVAARPTVVVRDFGIGQTASAVPDTLLSLHRGNKRDKPFLMGLYGWGGSNALSFAARSVLVTRRHSSLLGADVDHIGITVVKAIWQPGLASPTFVFATDAAGNIIRLDPSPEFEHGTQVSHIEYELDINGALVNQFNWYSGALFEPVLPIYLGSYRDVDSSPGRRSFVGSGGRLRSPDKNSTEDKAGTKIIHKGAATIDLGTASEGQSLGTVDVTYWVLDKDGAQPKSEIASGFVSADGAIAVTVNGQRQDQAPREFFKRVCHKPHLYKRLIVQVSADGMTDYAKANMIASTRERMRKPLHDRLLAELQDIIQNDDDLDIIEQKLRDDFLKNASKTVSEKDLKRLHKAIGRLGGAMKKVEVKTKVPVGGGGGGGGGGGEPRDTSDDHLPDVPTALSFEPDQVIVEQGGGRKRIMLKLDAKNGYLPGHNDDLSIVVEGPDGPTTLVGPRVRRDLAGGRAEWLIGADDSASIGDYKMTASLDVSGTILSASVVMSVIEPRARSGEKATGKGGRTKTITKTVEVPAGPSVSWAPAAQIGLDTQSVGEVTDEGAKGVDIVLCEDYEALELALKSGGKSPTEQENLKSRYMVPVALGLYRLNQKANDGDFDDDQIKSISGILAQSVLLVLDSEALLGSEEED
jgi:hypothetical protein